MRTAISDQTRERTMATHSAYQITLVTAVAVAILTACSARPNRFDSAAEARKAAAEQEAAQKAKKPEAEIPPLQFLEETPQVQQLGSADTTRAYRVGHVTVLHRRAPANEVVSARLYIVGGSTNLSEDTSGVEQLALTVAANGGTESTPKDAFNSKLDAVGSNIYSFAERDYSGFGMKTIVSSFDETWDLFTQVALEPAMPEQEVDLRRQKQLASLAAIFEDPDRYVSYVAAQNLFEGHPYYHLQIGTEENLKGFDRSDLLAHQRSLLDPRRLLVVVVGNVSIDDVLAKVKSSFGRLAPGNWSPRTLPTFQSSPTVDIVDRDLPTNYVLGYFPAPKPGDEDYEAMLVAVEYLRDRLFEEVRTKRNLTYAVSSGLSNRRTNYGYLYVTAVKPEVTMKVIFDQVEELKVLEVPQAELQETVNVFITNHYMGLETNGSQAAMLARAHLIAGDWTAYQGFIDRVRAVTSEDVKRVANKYFKDYRFGVVGPKAQLKKTFFLP